MREFDLNIEKILESWEIYHAVREIIANALDEQVLSQTSDIQIVKMTDGWHIIDFGRGLNYHHLTQNESEEKINNDKLIGRFGVGLKTLLQRCTVMGSMSKSLQSTESLRLNKLQKVALRILSHCTQRLQNQVIRI